MKKIKIRASNKSQDIFVFVGKPANGNHPLQFQSEWYLKHKLLKISDTVMNDVNLIYELSKEYEVDFYELLEKAIQESKEKRKRIHEEFLRKRKESKE